MRVNPVIDFLSFLTRPFYAEPAFLHFVYIALALISMGIAIAVWNQHAEQRTGINLFRFAVRFVIGSFWWQQTLWKFPTDTGGLRYWTEQEVQHAAFPIQGQLVKSLILPVFEPFAYGVYGFEVLVGVMLLLGLYTRLVSILGAGLILSLFTGLYQAPQEWPWSYAFLLILMLLIAVEDYGRALGLDVFRAFHQPNARLRRAAAMAS